MTVERVAGNAEAGPRERTGSRRHLERLCNSDLQAGIFWSVG